MAQYNVQEFSELIKAKYPEYKDIEATELTTLVLNKYPEYKEVVTVEEDDEMLAGKPQVESYQVDPKQTWATVRKPTTQGDEVTLDKEVEDLDKDTTNAYDKAMSIDVEANLIPSYKPALRLTQAQVEDQYSVLDMEIQKEFGVDLKTFDKSIKEEEENINNKFKAITNIDLDTWIDMSDEERTAYVKPLDELDLDLFNNSLQLAWTATNKLQKKRNKATNIISKSKDLNQSKSKKKTPTGYENVDNIIIETFTIDPQMENDRSLMREKDYWNKSKPWKSRKYDKAMFEEGNYTGGQIASRTSYKDYDDMLQRENENGVNKYKETASRVTKYWPNWKIYSESQNKYLPVSELENLPFNERVFEYIKIEKYIQEHYIDREGKVKTRPTTGPYASNFSLIAVDRGLIESDFAIEALNKDEKEELEYWEKQDNIFPPQMWLWNEEQVLNIFNEVLPSEWKVKMSGYGDMEGNEEYKTQHGYKGRRRKGRILGDQILITAPNGETWFSSFDWGSDDASTKDINKNRKLNKSRNSFLKFVMKNTNAKERKKFMSNSEKLVNKVEILSELSPDESAGGPGQYIHGRGFGLYNKEKKFIDNTMENIKVVKPINTFNVYDSASSNVLRRDLMSSTSSLATGAIGSSIGKSAKDYENWDRLSGLYTTAITRLKEQYKFDDLIKSLKYGDPGNKENYQFAESLLNQLTTEALDQAINIEKILYSSEIKEKRFEKMMGNTGAFGAQFGIYKYGANVLSESSEVTYDKLSGSLNAKNTRLENVSEAIFKDTRSGINLLNKFNSDKKFEFKIQENEPYVISEDGRKIPSWVVTKYNRETQKIQELSLQAQTAQNNLELALTTGLEKDLFNAAVLGEFVDKDFNDLTSFGDKAWRSGVNLLLKSPYGAGGLTGINIVLREMGINSVDDLMLAWDKWNQKRDASFGTPLTVSDIDSVQSLGAWTGNFIAGNWAPVALSILTYGMTNSLVAATALPGAAAGGEEEARLIAEAREKGEDYNHGQIWATNFAFTSSEIFTEMTFGGPLLKKFDNLFKGNKKWYKDYKVGLEGVYRNKIIPKVKLFVPEYVTPTLLDTAGEVVTQGIQNAAVGDPITKDMDEAALGSIMLSVSISLAGGGANLKGLWSKPFASNSQANEVRKLTNQLGENQKSISVLNDLIKSTSESNLFTEEEKSESLTQLEEDKDYLFEQQSDLLNKSATIQEDIKYNVTARGIRKSAAAKYAQFFYNISDLKNQAQKIETNGELTVKEKKEQIQELREQYNQAIQVMDMFTSTAFFGHGLLSMKGRNIFGKLNKEQAAEYNSILRDAESNLREKNPKKEKFTKKEITVEAMDVYDTREFDKQSEIAKEAYKKEGWKYELYDSEQQAVSGVKEVYNEAIEKEKDPVKKQELKDELEMVLEEGKIAQGQVNGFSSPLLNTEFVIKDASVRNQKTRTWSHEMFHRLSRMIIAKSPNKFQALSEEMLNYLETNDQATLTRMKLENENLFKKDGTVESEELISSFIEEVSEGNIKLDEGDVRVVYMGGLFNEGLSEATNGKTQIDFAGGIDISNFFKGMGGRIKSTAFEKQLAQYKTKIEEASVKIDAKQVDKIKSESTEPVLALSQTIINETPGEKSKRQDKRNVDVAEIYDQRAEGKTKAEWNEFLDSPRGNNVMGDLVQKYYPDMVATAIKQKAESPIDVASEAMIPLMQHIRAFNPIQNDDLAGYIGGYLGLKVGTGAKRVAKKTPTLSMEQEGVRQVAEKQATPTETVTIEEKTPTKQIKLKERLGDDAIKITEEVKERGKDIDLETVDFKTLKDLTPEMTQEMFGITPKPGNLTKADVRSAQQFIAKNADVLLAMLPEGATPSGTSTGVQKVLLDPFYTKSKRVTTKQTGSKAGLAEQVKRDNITKEEFLEVFGITPAGELNIADRNTSAKIKALVNQAGRMLTNQAIREQAQETGKKVPSRVFEGKSKVMFSEAYQQPIQLFGQAMRMKHGDLSQSKGFTPLKSTTKGWDLNDLDIEYRNRVFNKIQNRFHPKFFQTGSWGFSARSLFGAEEGLTGGQGIQLALNVKKGNDNKSLPPSRFHYKNISLANIKAKLKSKKWQDNEKRKLPYLKEIFLEIQEDLKENPDHLPFWEAFVKDAQNSQNHVLRYLAPFKFYSNVKGNLVEEHSMPQSIVGNYLLRSAIDGKVEENFKFIEDNYFQGALLESDDNKLKRTKSIDKEKYNFQSTMPEVFLESQSPETWMRYLNDLVSSNQGGINPNNYTLTTGKTIAENFKVEVAKEFQQNPDVVAMQQALIMIKIENTDFNPQPTLKAFTSGDLANMKNNSRKADLNILESSKVKSSKMYSKSPTNEVIRELGIMDKALNIARDPNAPTKKIRVFDFDDTLAQTKSNVLYTMPDGKTGKLTAEEFAKDGTQMLEQGAEFDFSEFNKVMEGKKGPLFEVATTIQNVRGTEDVFVLTARAMEAAPAIKEFLDSVGLDIPLENITGLGDSSPLAKSGWIVDKAAEGYNDFYFADDAIANVEAVQRAIDALPVKGKTQQAKVKFSMNTKRDLKWEGVKNDFTKLKEYKTSFELKGKTYNIKLYQFEKGKYELDFGLRSEEKRIASLGKVGITKTGNAAEVFSIVSNGVLDFVRANKAVEIQFSAIEPSRSRLYSTLTRFWANKLGWGHEADVRLDGSGYFTIGKDLQDASSFDNQSTPERKVLGVVDKKSKVQRAQARFSQNVDKDFNQILEQKTGIDWYKEYSAARAQTMGAGKGKFKFFIPPSAEDFTGLLYRFLGKGKVGDAQMAWFKEHLLNPYARGMNDLSTDRVIMMNDFNFLKKELVKSKSIPKNLKKKAIDNFTHEDVARVMAWDQQGIEVDGLSKRDMEEFRDFMKDNPGLQVFVDQLISINKGDGYAYPGKNWLAGSITSDLVEGLNTNKRDKYLQQWRENVDIIFSEKNLNKIEVAFGTRYREALENSLRRMKSGKNRISTGSRLENRLLDYINNSVGTVMFLNMRSGVLQTISAINFLNWSDNNPLKAGMAFANQKQYWSDFMTLMNSDFLVDRRKGLKINVTESEIADAARNENNKARAVVNYLLKKGFTVTQIMDSFAIASGGATFYRNRIKSLMKDGMSKVDAEAQAFQDFRETAEESQQSSRPDKISQQQASGAGRVILAFANTPMQYNRIIKKATLDLLNGRGDYKTNLSKILYYGTIQNIIFTALQQALFVLAADDEGEEEEKNRYYRLGNSMVDNILRGIGIGGTALMTGKNLAMDVYNRYQKSQDPDATWFQKQPHYEQSAWKLLEFSPPISIKLRKLRQAAKEWEYNKWRHDKDPWSLEDPSWLASAYVISSITNVPLDRLIKKINNVRGAMEADQDWWKRVAMLSGWAEWELETAPEREKRKKETKTEREEFKQLVKDREAFAGKTPEQIKQLKRIESLEDLKKEEQVDLLLKLGLSKKEIKDLQYEEDRISNIIKLQDKKKSYKPSAEKEKAKKLIERKEDLVDLNKEEQVDLLITLGLSKKEIKELKYEEDRVSTIIKLQDKKKSYKPSSLVSP